MSREKRGERKRFSPANGRTPSGGRLEGKQECQTEIEHGKGEKRRTLSGGSLTKFSSETEGLVDGKVGLNGVPAD